MKLNLGYKDWLEKYFPVEPSRKMTWEEAVTHCIQKWSGAHERVLEKHNAVKGTDSGIYFAPSGKAFHFDSTTCALCVKTGLERNNCEPCPLYYVRGRVECSGKLPEEFESPYDEFVYRDDFSAMLKWLRATRLFLKTKKWREIVAQHETKKKGL